MRQPKKSRPWGDKVYFCPVCKRQTGTYAVKRANDPRAFGHLHIESQSGQSRMFPNDGKIPEERVPDRTGPSRSSKISE